MDTTALSPAVPRRNRKHSPEFKAQVIAACLQPGVSIAAVALANQLNANFLRSWVKAHRDQQRVGTEVSHGIERRSDSTSGPVTALVPIALQATEVQPASDIQIEIRRQHTVFQITWPTSEATACAQWLREILR
ncbi:MAG TPA: transposase [Rhodoferax sp.]